MTEDEPSYLIHTHTLCYQPLQIRHNHLRRSKEQTKIRHPNTTTYNRPIPLPSSALEFSSQTRLIHRPQREQRHTPICTTPNNSGPQTFITSSFTRNLLRSSCTQLGLHQNSVSPQMKSETKAYALELQWHSLPQQSFNSQNHDPRQVVLRRIPCLHSTTGTRMDQQHVIGRDQL